MTVRKSQRTVSIGYVRGDGDFALLATLNNKDNFMNDEEFDHLYVEKDDLTVRDFRGNELHEGDPLIVSIEEELYEGKFLSKHNKFKVNVYIPFLESNYLVLPSSVMLDIEEKGRIDSLTYHSQPLGHPLEISN